MRESDRRAAAVVVVVVSLGVATVGLVACAEGRSEPRAQALAAPASDAGVRAVADGGEVFQLYERACSGGSALGCNNLALEIFEGRGSAAWNLTQAADLLQKACEKGLMTACGNLGYYLLYDKRVPRDETRALGLLTLACDRDYFRACGVLADVYSAGPREDIRRAAEVLERGCRGGDQPCCAGLGSLLYLGKSPIPKDEARALGLLQPACEARVPAACTIAASILLSKAANDASEQELLHIAEVYARGCVDGHPSGCYAYGAACTREKLADVCGDRADGALRRACEHGHADACATLAALLQRRGRR